jgi:hypothetical protein
MSDRCYRIVFPDQCHVLTQTELDAFRDLYVGDNELKSRISELFWLDVYCLLHAFGVSPFEMLDTIYELEQGNGRNGTKPATSFKNMPLKGLWHKHYFSAHFLARNILLGLGKNGAMRIIKEVMDPNKSPVVTQEMIKEVSYRIVHEPFEHRGASKQLTGEWLIYLPYNSKNHYLCCSTHYAGDQAIYDRIIQHCVPDFPDLADWIAAAQAAPQT